ncbi:MAG: hypothetical protein IT427_18860 [Pirellulales bacterium]|nr:hypothetical protein [Pirellulales bacterium]
MPRLIALEWDDLEARVAVAEVRRGNMTVEQAFAVALPAALAPGGTAELISASGAHDLGAIGRRIGEALLARGVRKSKTLVAVGRANIELKNLTLPPSPADELPELVRFQAEREFNALADNWPLDFIPQPSAANEPQTVLAAAISPELVAEIEVTCQAANLTPERLILRPCAAASLLSRVHPAEMNKLRLLVDLLNDEADLTVMAGDAVVFLRTARLPHDVLESDPIRALLPEIRRTIAAVQNRFQGQHVSEIFLCGARDDEELLVREIGRDLNLPAELFNPLTCCTLSPELQRALPTHPSRFTPLVGMLLDVAPGGAAVIDFLNPRRKPQRRSQRRKYAVPAIAAAVLLLAGVLTIWFKLYSLNSEIDELNQQIRNLDAAVKVAKETQIKVEQVKSWLAGDVIWLDELVLLSEKVPSNQDVVLTEIKTSLPNRAILGTNQAISGVRATAEINGLAKDRGIWINLPSALKDPAHHASVPVPKADAKEGSDKYPFPFSAKVNITEETKSARVRRATPGFRSGISITPQAAPSAAKQPSIQATKPEDKAI